MPEFIEIATGKPVEVPCGPLVFRIRRREVGDDGGISIELYGARAGEEAELLRFDLFRKDPHYHVPSGGNPTGHIDPAEDALAYALDRIESKLPTMLRDSDAAEHASAIEALAMAPVVGQLRQAAAQAPDPSESRRIELTPQVRALLGD
ncbi:MAG: hypothetical protein ABGY42_02010 [bacterium]|jgi:hypothetical protein